MARGTMLFTRLVATAAPQHMALTGCHVGLAADLEAGRGHRALTAGKAPFRFVNKP